MNTSWTMYEWKNLPWQKLERRAFKLQKRIYQASKRGDVKAVRRLQRLMVKSWSAKCLAVRRVTQDNQGKKTAGVDGIKALSPEARLSLTGQLKLTSKVKPTRRVWIPKPGKKEKRPLGIPTIYDRALQALVKLTIEPEWEAKLEPNSYGFRPGRSCHDAIGAIFNAIRYKPKFVLDADISKCFDCINHKKLLDKLNTTPTFRRQIKAWLKSGVMDGETLFPTDEGTPQGGVISPLLANIALHGMEEAINRFAPSIDMRDAKGHQVGPSTKTKSLNFIRYADDFVLLHEDKGVIETGKQLLETWLQEIGLELKPSKTRLVHTLETTDNPPGFNFLGFNLRQYKVGKHQSGKNTHKEKLGFKTIIKPTQEAIQRHHQAIKQTIRTHRARSQTDLIQTLNPIIRGWCNYYRSVVSKERFYHLDMLSYKTLWAWAKRRHPNKGKWWVSRKYWKTVGNDNWVFANGSTNPLYLIKHGNIKIIRHEKVRSNASPFDGNLVYWSSRMGKHPETPARVATLLRRQKGKCPHCELHFKEGDSWEIDHTLPRSKGGEDAMNNYQLLHRHCHDVKTTKDGSLERYV